MRPTQDQKRFTILEVAANMSAVCGHPLPV